MIYPGLVATLGPHVAGCVHYHFVRNKIRYIVVKSCYISQLIEWWCERKKMKESVMCTCTYAKEDKKRSEGREKKQKNKRKG